MDAEVRVCSTDRPGNERVRRAAETRGRTPVARVVFGRLFRHREPVPSVDGDQTEHRNERERHRHVRRARPQRHGDPDLVALRPRLASDGLENQVAGRQNRLGKRQTRFRRFQVRVHGEDHELEFQQVLQLLGPLPERDHRVTRCRGTYFFLTNIAEFQIRGGGG